MERWLLFELRSLGSSRCWNLDSWHSSLDSNQWQQFELIPRHQFWRTSWRRLSCFWHLAGGRIPRSGLRCWRCQQRRSRSSSPSKLSRHRRWLSGNCWHSLKYHPWYQTLWILMTGSVLVPLELFEFLQGCWDIRPESLAKWQNLWQEVFPKEEQLEMVSPTLTITAAASCRAKWRCVPKSNPGDRVSCTRECGVLRALVAAATIPRIAALLSSSWCDTVVARRRWHRRTFWSSSKWD